MLQELAPSETAPSARWHRASGRRITAHVPEGADDAELAAGALRRADRVWVGFERLFRGASPRVVPRHLTLYLQGARGVGQIPAVAIEDLALTLGDAEDLPLAVVRALVSRRFGAGSANAYPIVEGIAALLAAPTSFQGTIAAADAWVRAELAAGRSVSLLAGAPVGIPASGHAAASFVGYLLDEFEPATLARYLAAYDPERVGLAAALAFQQPLAGLEASWITMLGRPASSGAVAGAFAGFLLPWLRPYRWRLAEMLAWGAGEIALRLALPLGTKYLLDSVLPGHSSRQFAIFIGVLLAASALKPLLDLRRASLASSISQGVLATVQGQLYARLQRLPHSFYARKRLTDLLLIVSDDLPKINRVVEDLLDNGVFWALRGIVVAIVMLALSPLLTVLVLLVVPLWLLTARRLASRWQWLESRSHRRYNRSIGYAQEHLAGHGVIRAYSLEERAIDTFRAQVAAVLTLVVRKDRVEALTKSGVGLATALGQLLVLGFGGHLVIDGRLTIGTLVAFIALLPDLLTSVEQLQGTGQRMLEALGASRRCTGILEEPLQIADSPGAIDLPPLSRSLEFKGISAFYGGRRPVLHEFNLTVDAGSYTAIVGPSGCGKSTLVNLLLRFWEPEEGQILVDGHDLRLARLASLRGQIGLVSQETVVFATTLRENIGLGRPDATDAEIAAAAVAAQLDGLIASLPAGLDSLLGEGGVRLSGGQLQRMAIARALLRDPRVLILDEATTALDSINERSLLETLRTQMRGQTVIHITHQLTLAAQADQVVVLDQGRVVEQGPAAHLARAGGLYQRLYEEQARMHARGEVAQIGAEEAGLGAIPLFAGFALATLAAVAARLVRQSYEPGQDVVRHGELGDTMYIIERGQVDVLIGAAGSERRIDLLNEGDYFGEMALLGAAPRSATVRCITPVDLLALPRADFLDLMGREPSLQGVVEGKLATRRATLAATAGARGKGDVSGSSRQDDV